MFGKASRPQPVVARHVRQGLPTAAGSRPPCSARSPDRSRLGSVTDQRPDAAYPTLAARAPCQGSVPIIVGLDLALEPEGDLSGAGAVIQQRAIIQGPQSFFLRQLLGYEVTSIRQLQFIPFMAREVDAEALHFPAASPLVQSLVKDVPVPPSLDLSIPLIRANDAWAAGYEGAGQAVAVLDRGVDGRHSFDRTGHLRVWFACVLATHR